VLEDSAWGDGPPVRQPQRVRRPALDRGEQRQSAAAFARALAGDRQVPGLVAHERHGPPAQVRHDDPAELARGGGPPVAHHLEEAGLGVHVVAAAPLALPGGEAQLGQPVEARGLGAERSRQ
jgi:hypothetical protein